MIDRESRCFVFCEEACLNLVCFLTHVCRSSSQATRFRVVTTTGRKTLRYCLFLFLFATSSALPLKMSGGAGTSSPFSMTYCGRDTLDSTQNVAIIASVFFVVTREPALQKEAYPLLLKKHKNAFRITLLILEDDEAIILSSPN